MKPLGGKAYGSIPHLLGSKLGHGDHHISEGQHRICTEKTRDKHDLIIVQEKYDGSNCCIAKVDGKILALTRRGYLAETSPFEQHHKFAAWVEDRKKRFSVLMSDGDRIVGEWMYQAHGVKYRLYAHSFVAFDYFEGKKRLSFEDFECSIATYGLCTPRVLHYGFEPISIEAVMKKLNDPDNHPVSAIENPEGVIYRVERKEKVDFLAKYVRSDFEPGKYLPENNNGNVLLNEFIK